MKVIADISRKQHHPRGIMPFLSLMAAILLACVAPATPTHPNSAKGEIYNCADNSFTVIVPKDWKKTESGHPYGDLTRIAGVRLTGPNNPDDVPATISVLHYSGEPIFKTPDEFIDNQLNSIVRIDFDRKPLITDSKIAGRPGKTFQIKTFELVYFPQPKLPPMPEGVVYELAPPHKQVDIMEQYIVIPASQGYFVLSYRSPVKLVPEYQSIFAKVVGSFRPLLP